MLQNEFFSSTEAFTLIHILMVHIVIYILVYVFNI